MARLIPSVKGSAVTIRRLLRISHGRVAPSAISREDMIAARLRVAKVVPYQGASPPFLSNLTLAIVSGFLLVLAFPDWNLWSLGWVGTAPLILAVAREQRFWRAGLLGTLTGMIFYLGTTYWTTYSIHNYGGISLGLSYLALAAFATPMCLLMGLFAGVLARAIKLFGGWFLLSAPVLWTACEFGRLKITGMGWNALGYSQAFEPAVIQISRWGGVSAVSALLVGMSAALVFALVYLERARGIVVLSVAGGLAAAILLYGQSLRPTATGPAPDSITIAAIQANVPITGDWEDQAFVSETVRRHIKLSNEAIAGQPLEPDPAAATSKKQQTSSKTVDPSPVPDQKSGPQQGDVGDVGEVGGGDPLTAKAGEATLPVPESGKSNRKPVDLVVWPESPMPLEYDRDQVLQKILGDFTRANRVSLLFNTWADPDGKGMRNSAVIVGPSGDKVSEYDKIALLPFGEYIPGRGWLPFIGRVQAMVGDVTPGKDYVTSKVGSARVGTFICFEAARPEIVRHLKLAGASFLVHISNEAWFGPTAEDRQMLSEVVFRAVENDVQVIHATNSGPSGQIDRYGNVEGLTPEFETAVSIWDAEGAQVASHRPLTFYTRYGDVFAIVCSVLSIILSLLLLAPRKLLKRIGAKWLGRGTEARN